jgi:hypothetical protein
LRTRYTDKRKFPTLEDRIRDAAIYFREALDEADKPSLPIAFQEFPCGSCGDASETLGYFLRCVLNIKTTYVSAKKTSPGGDYQSHAWLEYKGFIIDVTADQFGREPVVVTQDHSWHERFGVPRRSPLPKDRLRFAEYCAPILALFEMP